MKCQSHNIINIMFLLCALYMKHHTDRNTNILSSTGFAVSIEADTRNVG